MGALLVFLVLGLPLSFVLGGGVPMIFLYFTWGPESFYMVAAQTWGAMNKFTLVAIPLFIFMAMILERSGVAKDLYEMMYLWFGPVAGGLAIGTVVICAIFSAMCGISGAAVVSMGTIALPSMLQRNYDKELALGCINSGGGWGILIPPSVIMILYAPHIRRIRWSAICRRRFSGVDAADSGVRLHCRSMLFPAAFRAGSPARGNATTGQGSWLP